jgi:hypothetical protein
MISLRRSEHRQEADRQPYAEQNEYVERKFGDRKVDLHDRYLLAIDGRAYAVFAAPP